MNNPLLKSTTLASSLLLATVFIAWRAGFLSSAQAADQPPQQKASDRVLIYGSKSGPVTTQPITITPTEDRAVFSSSKSAAPVSTKELQSLTSTPPTTTKPGKPTKPTDRTVLPGSKSG